MLAFSIERIQVAVFLLLVDYVSSSFALPFSMENISPVKLLALASLFTVIFNESLVYYLKSWQWNRLVCDTNECTRILLVADPQIIGETFDQHSYNSLAIFDSDRFLRKTFSFALYGVQPDVVVFMGDLMDEGSVAKNHEFERYVNRFKDVFNVPNEEIQLMHISGDNDVGGENGDSVTADKVNRFKKAFNERGHTDVKNNLRIFNINVFTHFFPNVTKEDTPTHYNRIVVSHMSLLSYPGLSTEKVARSIQPNVIFSAHQHVSRIITYPPMHIKHFNKGSQTVTYDFSEMERNHHLEIMVPTCSYRMGTKDIGYGLAKIENNRLQYTVLWLPNRFTYLYVYLVWISFCALFFLVCFLSRRCRKNRNSSLGYQHLTA